MDHVFFFLVYLSTVLVYKPWKWTICCEYILKYSPSSYSFIHVILSSKRMIYLYMYVSQDDKSILNTSIKKNKCKNNQHFGLPMALPISSNTLAMIHQGTLIFRSLGTENWRLLLLFCSDFLFSKASIYGELLLFPSGTRGCRGCLC